MSPLYDPASCLPTNHSPITPNVCTSHPPSHHAQYIKDCYGLPRWQLEHARYSVPRCVMYNTEGNEPVQYYVYKGKIYRIIMSVGHEGRVCEIRRKCMCLGEKPGYKTRSTRYACALFCSRLSNEKGITRLDKRIFAGARRTERGQH